MPPSRRQPAQQVVGHSWLEPFQALAERHPPSTVRRPPPDRQSSATVRRSTGCAATSVPSSVVEPRRQLGARGQQRPGTASLQRPASAGFRQRGCNTEQYPNSSHACMFVAVS
eukprot:TRINITY_DN5214_c0_g4_i1.p1 TRINITY_DN5214_c0_g4~~TRINITY_DN5214_c0_g4_i1.p1  ORF type:complete len:113 (+),score=6.54 TRINITY_DN5214_c0_g4_i1:273-611(+)